MSKLGSIVRAVWLQALEECSQKFAKSVRIMRTYSRPGILPDQEETRPYLHRFYLAQGRLGSLFLHKIVDSDNGPEIHNHPWAFSCAFILAGSYTEERLVGYVVPMSPLDPRRPVTLQRKVSAGSLNVLMGTDFHRLQIEPGSEVWTLFYHLPKRIQKWGFLYPSGVFVPVEVKSRPGETDIDPKASSEDDE